MQGHLISGLKVRSAGWCLGRRCGHRASSYVCFALRTFAFLTRIRSLFQKN